MAIKEVSARVLRSYKDSLFLILIEILLSLSVGTVLIYETCECSECEYYKMKKISSILKAGR